MSTIIDDLEKALLLNNERSPKAKNQKKGNHHYSLFSEQFSSIYQSEDGAENYSKLLTYNNQILMQLEDIIAYNIRAEKHLITLSENITKYMVNDEYIINQSQTLNRGDCYWEDSEKKINTLIKINNFFFSHTDLIQRMEEEYKTQCNSDYECQNYEDFKQKKNILDQEIEKYLKFKKQCEDELIQARHEKEKYEKKNKCLQQNIENYQKSIRDVQELYQEKESELKMLKDSKKVFEEKSFECEKIVQEYMNLKEVLLRQVNEEKQRLSISPQTTSRTISSFEEKQENYKKIISRITQKINSNVDPINIATNIIDELKEAIEATEKINYIEKVNKLIISNELKAKSETIVSYLRSEKNKLIEERKILEKDFQFFNFFKVKENFKDENDYIKKSVNRIMKEKKELKNEREILFSSFATLKCFEEGINKSVSIFKETYKDLFVILKFLDEKLWEINIFFEKVPELLGTIKR